MTSDTDATRTEQRLSKSGEQLVRRRAIEQKSSRTETQIDMGDSTFLKIAHYGGSLLNVTGTIGLFLMVALLAASVFIYGPTSTIEAFSFGMIGINLLAILVGVSLQWYARQAAGVVYG